MGVIRAIPVSDIRVMFSVLRENGRAVLIITLRVTWLWSTFIPEADLGEFHYFLPGIPNILYSKPRENIC